MQKYLNVVGAVVYEMEAPELKGPLHILEELIEVGGGAGRDRTAASQFCRLLP